MLITIDGISGQGKSTVGELLADRLGISFFSTGLVIRFLAKAYQQLTEQGVGHREIMQTLHGGVSVDTVQYLKNRDNDDLCDGGLLRYFVFITSDSDMLRRVDTALDEYRRGRDIILDGRNLFEIFPDADVRFYFESTIERRAKILQLSKGISRPEALERLRLRDDQERTFNIPRADLTVLNPLADTLDHLVETMYREVTGE